MPPLYALATVFALTLAAVVAEVVRRRDIQHALRKLAVERKMHFSTFDQLRLAPRVAEHLPIPGAGYIRVSNLIYGSDGKAHRYFFTAEFTTGVVRSKKRTRRVGTFSEPRQRAAMPTRCIIQMAPAELSVIDQYRTLLDQNP